MRDSFIVQLAARFFELLHCISPSKRLKSLLRRRSGYRELHGVADAYIIGSFLVAATLLLTASRWPNVARAFWYVPAGIALIRIIEIFGMTFDVLVFDRVRSESHGMPHSVASWERALLLGLFNFLELILDFAVLYFVVLWDGFNQAYRPDVVWDAIYFSTATITTVGYGDIQPLTTPARLCAAWEALVGLLALTLIVSRVVSILPVSPVRRKSDAAHQQEAAGSDPGRGTPKPS